MRVHINMFASNEITLYNFNALLSLQYSREGFKMEFKYLNTKHDVYSIAF